MVEGDFDFVVEPDLLIYFDVPDEIRLANRIKRDLVSRNVVDEDEIRENFQLRQKLQHFPYTLSTKAVADIVVNVMVDDNGEYLYEVVDQM